MIGLVNLRPLTETPATYRLDGAPGADMCKDTSGRSDPAGLGTEREMYEKRGVAMMYSSDAGLTEKGQGEKGRRQSKAQTTTQARDVPG